MTSLKTLSFSLIPCLVLAVSVPAQDPAKNRPDSPQQPAEHEPLPDFLVETADGLILPRTLVNVDPPPPELNAQGVPVGNMIIEGDIIVPEDFYTTDATYATNWWPNGIVPFRFDANVTAANQTRMLNAMAEWEAVANVDFIPRTNEFTFVHIQDANANNSAVGMLFGQQIINISDWNSRFVICHELAHCLGVWHEQSRSDRDQFVQINFNNVCDCCGTNNTESCDHNFNIAGGSRNYGPYDFDSVMHYGQCAFSTCRNCDPGCETITVLAPNQSWQTLIGQRDHLSEMDVLTMSFMYPEGNWRFLDENSTSLFESGTFIDPWKILPTAFSQTPTGGTLWVQPGSYNLPGGLLNKAMTIRAPLGGVTLSD